MWQLRVILIICFSICYKVKNSYFTPCHTRPFAFFVCFQTRLLAMLRIPARLKICRLQFKMSKHVKRLPPRSFYNHIVCLVNPSLIYSLHIFGEDMHLYF